MKVICFVLFVAVLVPSLCSASDKDLAICAAGGYFSGSQDRFMSGIATYVLEQKGVLRDARCSEIWKRAYDVGVSFSKTGLVANESDAKIVKDASDFSSKIYAAVIKNTEF